MKPAPQALYSKTYIVERVGKHSPLPQATWHNSCQNSRTDLGGECDVFEEFREQVDFVPFPFVIPDMHHSIFR